MTKENVVAVLKSLRDRKKGGNLKIVDTHVHPLDVMGVVHHGETKHRCPETDYLSPGPLEIFNYSKIEKLGSRIYFKLFPGSVAKIITRTYCEVNEERIMEEMEASLVDQSVLLSLDPWVPTDSVGSLYVSNKKFLILGSLDVHSINASDIEKTIQFYVEKYHIVGLKFHPNIQNFMPQPSHNTPLIAERLRKIYEVAAKYRLYILFHGGISNYTNAINLKYGKIERSRTNALLKHFINLNGASELFEYGVPIIIAHIGHYGMVNIDYSLIRKICERYSNVFFDTSGVSTNTIRNALRVVSSKRIVFGSDALYNRMAYNLAFLYNAVMTANGGEKYETILANVLGRNFERKILKQL